MSSFGAMQSTLYIQSCEKSCSEETYVTLFLSVFSRHLLILDPVFIMEINLGNSVPVILKFHQLCLLKTGGRASR